MDVFCFRNEKRINYIGSERIVVEKRNYRALIRMNGSLSFSNRKLVVDIQTENAAIARRIYTLLKKSYEVQVELLVRKKMRLKKNNVYIVRMSQKGSGF